MLVSQEKELQSKIREYQGRIAWGEPEEREERPKLAQVKIYLLYVIYNAIYYQDAE
jgi:hypothetical protein